MIVLFAAPFALQGLAIFVDEFYFHRARGLPQWEKIGHPLDTLTVGLCFGYLLAMPFSRGASLGFVALSVFSCVFVTKDEWVHKKECSANELWLHSLLFVLHPIVLILAGFIWYLRSNPSVAALSGWDNSLMSLAWLAVQTQAAIVAVFFVYQLVYWNFIWKRVRQ